MRAMGVPSEAGYSGRKSRFSAWSRLKGHWRGKSVFGRPVSSAASAVSRAYVLSNPAASTGRRLGIWSSRSAISRRWPLMVIRQLAERRPGWNRHFSRWIRKDADSAEQFPALADAQGLDFLGDMPQFAFLDGSSTQHFRSAGGPLMEVGFVQACSTRHARIMSRR